MKKRITNFLLVSLLAFVFYSCKKSESEKQDSSHRTVLIYIAGNNDLKDEAIMTIRKLQHGVSKVNGNLLVYIKIDAEKSHLLRLKHSNSSIVDCDTLKTYGNENSSEPSFLATVIHDSRILYPADSYGLILWSHATSWAPPAQMLTPFAFGQDQKKEMDIKDLKFALTDDYEYIIFDACSMASAEVVFELRNKARYILSSPTEVLSSGFPYEKAKQLATKWRICFSRISQTDVCESISSIQLIS